MNKEDKRFLRLFSVFAILCYISFRKTKISLEFESYDFKAGNSVSKSSLNTDLSERTIRDKPETTVVKSEQSTQTLTINNQAGDVMTIILTSNSENGEKQRSLIRKTWLSDKFTKSHAVFLVGENNNTDSKMEENDLILLPMKDTYQNLATKTKLGIKWVVENTDAKWIFKVDDDVYTDIRGVQNYLKQIDHTKPYLIGRFSFFNNGKGHSGVRVMTKKRYRDERWIDNKYDKRYYPQYANGASGYIISRPIAEYITQNSDILETYVLEDASVGIWIDESPFKDNVIFVNDWYNFRVRKQETCWLKGPPNKINVGDKLPFVIAHNIRSEKVMNRCHSFYKS